MARSENLLGPWEKYEKNPVLIKNEDWKCTGHGSVVEHGDDFYFLYHAYSSDGSVYVGREAVLEKIQWTEEGWPIFENNAEYNRDRSAWNFTDDFESGLNSLWQWRVTQDINYQTGSDGLMIQASTKNETLGTLLVQPTTSPDYEISATVDLEKTGDDVDGGIALIGAASNGFGAPVAGMGISAGRHSVKVWKTVRKKTQIIEELPVNKPSNTIDLKMKVTDGHLLTFSVKKDNSWEGLSENEDVSKLVPWGMGFRLGITAKGDSSQYANIQEFNLINH